MVRIAWAPTIRSRRTAREQRSCRRTCVGGRRRQRRPVAALISITTREGVGVASDRASPDRV